MMNLDLIFPEIFLSLSVMLLLMIGVFKKNSENLVLVLSSQDDALWKVALNLGKY